MTIEKKSETKNLAIRISRGVLAFLRWITFGKVDLEYERRTTTIGEVMYTGTGWDAMSAQRREREIRHEAVHVTQYKTWGPLYYVSYLLSVWHVASVLVVLMVGGRWYVGLIAFLLASGIPACLSLRAYWEYRAFQVSIQTIKDQGNDAGIARDAYNATYTRLLTGTPYFYAAWLIKPVIRRLWAKYLKDIGIGEE